MKNCKRPRTTDEEKDFPADCSEEEKQWGYNFVRKVKELSNKKTFAKFARALKSYQSKSISYINLKTKIVFILRNHDGLLQEFHQLLSDLATIDKNRNTEKSDVERTVDILNNIEALGKDLHSAFLTAFALDGDIQDLIEQLDVVLRDHTSLKEKFKEFLIDSRLLKKPKHDLEVATTQESVNVNVTPSYWSRPEVVNEEDENINTKYVSKGEYDESKVKEKIHSLQERRMNNLEDILLKEDRYFEALKKVVKFGNKASEKNPPVRFNDVVNKFYDDRGNKRVPQEFEKNPKLAIQGILPTLQRKLKKMSEARRLRAKEIYDLHQVKNNVNE